MNIPGKVKISYITFDVIIKETLTVMDRDLQFGEIDYFNGKINIYKGNESNTGKSDFCKEQQECSLIHEAIHGMNEFNKIGLTEEQIVKLGMAFYNFIKDNPKVFKEKADNIKTLNSSCKSFSDIINHNHGIFVNKIREELNKIRELNSDCEKTIKSVEKAHVLVSDFYKFIDEFKV